MVGGSAQLLHPTVERFLVALPPRRSSWSGVQVERGPPQSRGETAGSPAGSANGRRALEGASLDGMERGRRSTSP